jgi:hypothetical protein
MLPEILVERVKAALKAELMRHGYRSPSLPRGLIATDPETYGIDMARAAIAAIAAAGYVIVPGEANG